MTSALRYVVVVTNQDGFKATSRFMSPVSAYDWVSRAKKDALEFEARKVTDAGVEVSISASDLKKEADKIAKRKLR